MHGFGREFDVSPLRGIVNLGYFKDGEPFEGRFEKFEMDEVWPLSNNHKKEMLVENEYLLD